MSILESSTRQTIGTTRLKEGQAVYTTKIDGEDFGLPLVSPTRGTIRGVVRTVRSVHNHTVRFTDGTKSRRIHGRTVWLAAPAEEAS